MRILIVHGLALIVAISAPMDALADAATPDPLTTGILGTSSGEAVYTQICQGCHMPEGRGAVGAGYYPAFAGNPTLASSRYMAATILNGRRNMPSFEQHANNEFFFPPTWLTDTQIANVVNYIRSHFGNHYTDSISAADVAALHAKEPAQ
jgi:mono/diheme cytochrome c family protein